MDEKNIALEAIRKKLIGKKLSYKEIFAVMDEIANNKLGDILTTYFVASGYSKGFSDEEIYYLTRAMVETGEKLHFKGIVADKHSIGGVPGTRLTMIIVPIVASAGFKIPKSSSRAITTPAGTADAMEVLADVTFDEKEIYKIIDETKGCIVWGGSFKIAPADDEIIRIEEPLLFESFDKILVSVMAKKIAFGSNHVVIDLPYGKTAKIHNLHDVNIIAEKFKQLARRFNIKLEVSINDVRQPAGNGIGPLLEARDALKVLEQTDDRPIDLEKRAIGLSSQLLDLCIQDSVTIKKDVFKKYKNTKEWVKDILISGRALFKMKEIIKIQKGNPRITSLDLHPGEFSYKYKAKRTGEISFIDNKNLTIIAKVLGAPQSKKAGIYLYKRLGDIVEKGEPLFSLYSESRYKLNEALESLELFPLHRL